MGSGCIPSSRSTVDRSADVAVARSVMTWVNRGARSSSGGGEDRFRAWTAWSDVARTAESSPSWRMPRAVAGAAVSGRDAAPSISVANRAPVRAEAWPTGSASAR